MPRPEDYEALAPFSMEELVSAVNSIFRDRPVLAVQSRTVRYYVSSGLLPPPSGGPKFARYTMEHLRRIIAVRQWLDQGISLEESAQKITAGDHLAPFEELMTPVVHVPQMKSESRRSQSREVNAPRMRNEPHGEVVRRMRLTPHSVLEVSGDSDLYRELDRAAEAIRRLQADL
jgi:DNA-binding transcriptional MerR regulator